MEVYKMYKAYKAYKAYKMYKDTGSREESCKRINDSELTPLEKRLMIMANDLEIADFLPWVLINTAKRGAVIDELALAAAYLNVHKYNLINPETIRIFNLRPPQ